MHVKSCFKMQNGYHSEGCVTQRDSTQHDTNDALNYLLIFGEISYHFFKKGDVRWSLQTNRKSIEDRHLIPACFSPVALIYSMC